VKITVFTGNQPRHLSLIKDLANICDEVFAVIEVNTIFPGRNVDFFKKSEIMQEYFSNVINSEKKIFGEISLLPGNVKSMIVKSGDLNDLSMGILAPLLKSDEYVVFGSSYIKGDLIDFLVSKKAYNIHMGVSPYYRGSSCNFWASYDRNFTMVGATIHLLTKGLDSGPILFHALPKQENNAFDLGMKAVKCAHSGLVQHLTSGKIKEFHPIIQDKAFEIRYTKNSDFDDIVALEYLNNLPTHEEISDSFSKLDISKYLNLFIY
jgi:folate-dependent phosphoribosylglycinamide formyltransferase PurN